MASRTSCRRSSDSHSARNCFSTTCGGRACECFLLAVLSLIASACVDAKGGSITPADWWQNTLYNDPPTDRQLERHLGETILVTFRWDGSSSILHSTMVVGQLRGFDDETLRIATSDGKDGACMPEAYWKLLAEYGRVAPDADHQGDILVRREFVDRILRTEHSGCR